MQKAPLATYAGIFLVVAGVGFAIGMAKREPLRSAENPNEQPAHKLGARQQAKAEENARAPMQEYRYGPEVNHGRSDTPVYATQQAIKQAREGVAPARITPRKSYRSRVVGRTGSEMYGH